MLSIIAITESMTGMVVCCVCVCEMCGAVVVVVGGALVVVLVLMVVGSLPRKNRTPY